MNRIKILNVEIDNISQEELLAQLKKGVLVTPNVDQIVKMQTDREYYDIVRRAEWCVCDSKILLLCSRLLGTPLKEAVPGSSFFPASMSIIVRMRNVRYSCWELWMAWPRRPWLSLTRKWVEISWLVPIRHRMALKRNRRRMRQSIR